MQSQQSVKGRETTSVDVVWPQQLQPTRSSGHRPQEASCCRRSAVTDWNHRPRWNWRTSYAQTLSQPGKMSITSDFRGLKTSKLRQAYLLLYTCRFIVAKKTIGLYTWYLSLSCILLRGCCCFRAGEMNTWCGTRATSAMYGACTLRLLRHRGSGCPTSRYLTRKKQFSSTLLLNSYSNVSSLSRLTRMIIFLNLCAPEITRNPILWKFLRISRVCSGIF